MEELPDTIETLMILALIAVLTGEGTLFFLAGRGLWKTSIGLLCVMASSVLLWMASVEPHWIAASIILEFFL
ncbi:hypothetical protein DYY90_00100, partial [Pseudomonas aeruginosa]|nr:hypothetical protein [Pseudomonas aeruginosa]